MGLIRKPTKSLRSPGLTKMKVENNQKAFYIPIKEWLESQGFETLITSMQSKIVVPIGDILPTKGHFVPDLIGMKGDQVVIVEVETNLDEILKIIGKCMIWKTVAALVYVAYPLEKCQKFRLFEKIGLGLLGVSETGVVEEIVELPKERENQLKIVELYPLDPLKEMELARYIKSILEV